MNRMGVVCIIILMYLVPVLIMGLVNYAPIGEKFCRENGFREYNSELEACITDRTASEVEGKIVFCEKRIWFELYYFQPAEYNCRFLELT